MLKDVAKSILVKGKYEKKDYGLGKNLSNLTNSGVLDSSSYSIANSYITPYALALGATNAEIGFLNALKGMAQAVGQLPGARMTDMFSRKFVFIFAMIVSRLFWIPIIILPFLHLSNTVFLLIVLFTIATFVLNFNSPAWASLAGDIVPESIRGRYFGKRNFITGLSGLIATMAAGVLVYYGFPLIFIISVVLGLASLILFARIAEPKTRQAFHYKYSFSFDMKAIKNGILINKELTMFTIFLAFMNFAVNVASPFFAVYQLRDMNVGYLWFGALLSFGALTTIIFQPYWGRLSDRFGNKKIVAANGILVCFVPFLYLFVSSPWHILGVEVFSSFAWSGFDMATFNFMLALTPQGKRSQYIANHRFFIGIGAIAGALLGGIAAESLKNSSFLFWHGLQLIFLLSFVLRVASLAFITKMPGVEKKPVEYFLYRSIAIEPVRSITHTVYTFRFENVEKIIINFFNRIYYKIKMLSA
ncbi:MAG: MFS transporter [Candidatus Aenigmatarchaeota archaeon]